jgi:hypothetical protein
MPDSSNFPHTFRNSRKNSVPIFHIHVRATCIAHIILFDLTILGIINDE